MRLCIHFLFHYSLVPSEVSPDLLVHAARDGGHDSVPLGSHLCRDAVHDEALCPVS